MANEKRKIAKALHNRAEEEEKRDAKKFFQSLDLNGDGKISFSEFIEGVESRISNERDFQDLGSNRDGTLNFDDALVLFYYNKKAITIPRCRACYHLILGPSFSCFECLRNSSDRYLCCDCYGEGKSIPHNHPSSSSVPTTPFSHDQVLLAKFAELTPERENTRETEDGIKSVAKVYYKNASGIEKEEVNEYLSRFGSNRDRKISLVEFKRLYNKSSNEAAADNMFKLLDSNKDGLLDFDDILVLFYAEVRHVIRLSVCDGYCGGLLSGPYFSCVPCLSQFPNTYDLCCHCYGQGDFYHHHPSAGFLHDQGLITKFTGQPKTHLTGEMEELQNIAMLHYNATPPDVKVKAKQFFYSMDRDGDGKVNERDFLSFMREQKLDHLRDGGFFEKIDMDGDRVLCFEEVMTLYYLIRSGRPHCDWCRKFIPGVFFSCIRCFRSQTSFILCRTCYQSNDCDHARDHGGATAFLDNYTLLETIKQSSLHSNDH